MCVKKTVYLVCQLVHSRCTSISRSELARLGSYQWEVERVQQPLELPDAHVVAAAHRKKGRPTWRGRYHTAGRLVSKRKGYLGAKTARATHT